MTRAGDLMLRFGIVLEDISHADDAALARPTMTDLGQLALHLFHVEEYIHEQGRLAGQQEVLKRLLAQRFGDVPEVVAKHIKAASFPELEAMTERLLKANTVDEVLGKTRQRKASRKAATSTPRRR